MNDLHNVSDHGSAARASGAPDPGGEFHVIIGRDAFSGFAFAPMIVRANETGRVTTG